MTSTPEGDRYPEPDGIVQPEPPHYAWDVRPLPAGAEDEAADRRERARQVPETVGQEQVAAMPGTRLGAIGLLGSAITPVLVVLLWLAGSVSGLVAAGVVLASFLLVTVLGYLRFRRGFRTD